MSLTMRLIVAVAFLALGGAPALAQVGGRPTGPVIPPTKLGGNVTAGQGISVAGSTVSIAACPNGQTQVSNGSGYACTSVGSGGSISGLTAGYVPYATNATTIADSPLYRPSTTSLEVASNATLLWSSTTSASGTPDVGISRLSAGKLRIEDGAAALRDLGVRALTASTTIDATGAMTADGGLRVFDIAGAGLASTTNTVRLADTAVTPGSYTSANITVDQQGRITAAANGSGGGGGDITDVNGTAGRITVTGSTGPTPTVDLASGVVSAGSCTNCNITVDTYGRVTAKANGSGGGGPGTGTPTYFPIWDGAGTALTNSIMSQPSTSTVNITSSNGDAPTFRWENTGTGGRTYNMGTSNNAGSYPGSWWLVDSTAGALRLELASNGNFTAYQSLTVGAALAVTTSAAIGTTLGVGTNLTVNGTSLLIGDVNAEANVQLDSAGDITFSSTGTAGGSVDAGITRSAAGQIVINDGDGTATTDYRDLVIRNGYWTTLAKTVAAGEIEWSSTTGLAGTTDIAIQRAAAGLLSVYSGTSGQYRDAIARTWYGNETGPSFKAVALGRVEWSSSSTYNAATDVALGRNAAGIVEVNNGTAGTLRDLTARYLTSSGQFQSASTGTTFSNTLDTKGFALDTSGSPGLSGCGTTGSAVTTGRNAFSVTIGTGPTTCVATFATPFSSRPTCTVTRDGGAAAYDVSASAVTLKSPSATFIYDVVCIGH